MDKDIDEAVDQSTPAKEEMPEAPGSVTIRGYYKGYSVLITKRLMKNGAVKPLLEDAEKIVDYMVKTEGYKNTWDKEELPARQAVAPKPMATPKSALDKEAQAVCQHQWGEPWKGVKDPSKVWEKCLKCEKVRPYVRYSSGTQVDPELGF